jgi:hypothetical protein
MFDHPRPRERDDIVPEHFRHPSVFRYIVPLAGSRRPIFHLAYPVSHSNFHGNISTNRYPYAYPIGVAFGMEH